MTRAAAVAPPDAMEGQVVRMVRLEELEPSPFNTRVIVEDDAMRGLVESIRVHGIQQPLLCREVEIEGEVVKFEIVAGHRRFFAARLAGIETAPAIFREMTDDEAREIQIIENLQRAELPPLEEAQAFDEAMMFHGGKMLSVQELAARLGKSPVYINRRLTLLDATGAVQFALSRGLIEVGHALELARLSESEQERLLKWLGVVKPNVGLVAAMGDDEDEDGFDDEDDDREDDWTELNSDEEELDAKSAPPQPTSRSVIELRRYIGQTTLQVLSAAPFDPNDADLVEEAGSCADCLKRSGSAPLLFSDVNGDDICTDRACFEDKVKTHIAREISKAKTEKRPLLQLYSRWGDGPDGAKYQHDVKLVKGEPCAFGVPAIYLDGSNAGKMVTVCLDKACKEHKGRYSGGAEQADPEKAKADRKKLLARVKVEKAYRLQLLKECLAKPIDPLPTDEMVRALVLFAFGRFDSTKEAQLAEALAWDKDIFGWKGEKARVSQLMAITQADAIRVVLVGLKASELTVYEQEIGNKRELGLEGVAKLIGVDAKKVRAAVDPEFAKPAAKKAAKKAPAKKAAKKKAAKL